MTDINYALLPEHLRDGMRRYIEEHFRPDGDFLFGVLINNFIEACGPADSISIQHLPEIALFLYNEAPSGCWGSTRKVEKWLKAKEKLGEEKK